MNSITIFDQQLVLNKFTFYNNALGTILREFEGFDYPEVRTSIDDIAGTVGAIYINSKFGRRRMGITGDLIGTDVYEKRRQLVKVLRQTGSMKLLQFTTYDDLPLQCEVEVVSYKNPYTHQIHTFLIELVAPDYRFYSQTETTVNIGRSVLLGGGSIPTAVPMSLPLSAASELGVNTIVTSIGTEQTDPIITIYGPGTNFTLRNESIDAELLLTLTLTSEDSVVIDIKNKTVVKNGVTNVYTNASGDFWSIQPGENDLTFLVQSGFTTDTLLEIKYRDAYGGI